MYILSISPGFEKDSDNDNDNDYRVNSCCKYCQCSQEKNWWAQAEVRGVSLTAFKETLLF